MLYDCPCCFGDKPVFVRVYTRTRFGRKERVRAHCRRLPKR